MNVLIIYASIEGQSARIAEVVEKELQQAGNDVSSVNALDTSTITLDGVDKVVLVAPVHERRHPKLFEALLIAQNAQMAERDTLLISVSLSAAFPEGLEEAGEYVTELKMRTGLEPDAVILAAGAIRTGHYDYFSTQVLRHVVLRDRDYDPKAEEHEFTDWSALSRDLAAFMSSEKVPS